MSLSLDSPGHKGGDGRAKTTPTSERQGAARVSAGAWGDGAQGMARRDWREGGEVVVCRGHFCFDKTAQGSQILGETGQVGTMTRVMCQQVR